jgi:NAD+ diphosphatase
MPFSFPFDAPSERLGFAVNPLDRMSEQRIDSGLLERLSKADAAGFIVFVGDKVVIDRASLGDDRAASTILLSPDKAAAFGVGPRQAINYEDHATVFLGLAGDRPGPHEREHAGDRVARFAGLSRMDPDAVAATGFELIDLRSLVLTEAVPPDEAGAAAQGRALFNWHLSHAFCARCGTPSVITHGGYRRDCPNCSAQHFPRTDPVVIMAVIDGDRVLLGRQSRFPPGMYSCLAGFLEPGETIEDAVRRETWEEAGIRVGRVGYHSSQPWPFPASLMIGCIGEALTRDIVPDATELEDCRWFSRAEAVAMLEGTHAENITAPKSLAIAHHLLRAFVEMA